MGCNQSSHCRWRQKRAWLKSRCSPHFQILIPSYIDLSPSNYPKSVENCCGPKMHTEVVLATPVIIRLTYFLSMLSKLISSR